MRVAVVVIGLLSVVVVGPAAAHVFAVRGDAKIGAYAVRADGSLAGALRAFGQPNSRRHTFGRGTCRAAWARHGLTIDFYNLGGGDACEPRNGRFSRAFLRGDHWMTTKRLRIGDSVAKLRRLYPDAAFRRGERGFWPSGYWLLPRRSVFGDGAAYPGLLAEVARGRVLGFHVRFPAGGD